MRKTSELPLPRVLSSRNEILALLSRLGSWHEALWELIPKDFAKTPTLPTVSRDALNQLVFQLVFYFSNSLFVSLFLVLQFLN